MAAENTTISDLWREGRWQKLSQELELLGQSGDPSLLEERLTELRLDDKNVSLDKRMLIAAYCYYRLGRPIFSRKHPSTDQSPQDDEKKNAKNAAQIYQRAVAQKLLQCASVNSNPEILHLAAQWLYATNHFKECVTVYRKILRQDEAGISQDRSDVLANLCGAESLAHKENSMAAAIIEADGAAIDHDSLFNLAFASISIGKFERATDLLNQALNRLNTGDFGGQNEYLKEWIPIVTQLLYCYAIQEDSESYERILKEINEHAVEFNGLQSMLDTLKINPATQIVLQNNIAILTKEGKYTKMARLSKPWSSVDRSKLLPWQEWLIQQNTTLIRDGSEKEYLREEERKKVPTLFAHTLLKKYPDLSAPKEAFKKRNIGKEEKLRRKLKNFNIYALASFQQAFNKEGDLNKLRALVKRYHHKLKTDEERYSPRMVAIMYSISRQLGLHGVAKRQLIKAAKYWRRNTDPQKYRAMSAILKESIFNALATSRNQRIAEQDLDGLEALMPLDPDISELRSIVQDSERQEAIVDVESLRKQVIDIDGSALEEAGVVMEEPSERSSFGTKGVKARRRRRKHIQPKSIDHSKTLNPERWIRKCYRSDYKPKKRPTSKAGKPSKSKGKKKQR